MQGRVSLRAILEAMQFQSDELTGYLHRPSGRVMIVSDEALRSAEEDDEDSVDPLELADARGIVAGGDDYVELPDRFEVDEYRMMERFAAGIVDPGTRDDVLQSLRGRGAFGRFKDAVRHFGLADDWYTYRDRGYEEIARAWCEQHGIAVGESAADV